jgi:hypothetical protein
VQYEWLRLVSEAVSATPATPPAVVTKARYHVDALPGAGAVVRASAGNLYGFTVINNEPVLEVYLKLYDAAALGGVTLGTTVPRMVIPVPANGAIVVTDGDVDVESFASGIVAFAVTSKSDASTALPASAPLVEIRHGA